MNLQNMDKTVNKVFSFIMGSPTTRDYDMKQVVSYAGPGNTWKIHAADSRKIQCRQASVFVFDKKFFEGRNWIKKDQERLIELLRKEAEKLAKFRHPSFLEIIEPIDESRLHLTFVTESLSYSLSDLFQRVLSQNQVNRRMPLDYQNQDEYSLLDELEIQKGLQQIAKALVFCHQEAGIIHAQLTPQAVFINSKGDWKLGGLAWSIHSSEKSLTLNTNQSSLVNFAASDELYRPNGILRPTLDYMAPECVLDRQIGTKSDMFSFACLIYDIFSYSSSSMLNTAGSIDAYKRTIDRLGFVSIDAIPLELRDTIRQMLNRFHDARPAAAEFLRSKYFDNTLMSTMVFLDNIYEKSQDDKIQFFKGLKSVLVQFPRRVLIWKILPALIEGMKDAVMRVHILPSIFVIQDKLSERDFVEKLWPLFRDILHHKESHETLLLLLDNMSLILTKLSKHEIQQELAPSVMSLLDSAHPYILQRALKTIYGLMTQMDYSTIKSRLFPKLQAIYHASTNIAVRVHVMTCIRGTLPHLDQYTITGKVLPMLKENRPNNPMIYLACFTVYEDLALNYLTKELVANEILPELWKMALSSAFTLNQFNQAMETIKKLSKKLEEDQRQYLMEISKSESSKLALSQPSDLRTHNAAQAEFENLVRSPSDYGRKSTDVSQNPAIPPQLPPRRISTPNAVIKQIDALAQKSLDLNMNSASKPKSQEPIPLWSQNTSMRRDGSNVSLNEFDPMFK